MMYDVCICGTQRRVEPCFTQIEQSRGRTLLLLMTIILVAPLATRVRSKMSIALCMCCCYCSCSWTFPIISYLRCNQHTLEA